MKIEYLAFPTNKFPCFGFLVCTEKGKKYLPEYDEKDTVCNFEEIGFETMYLQECDNEYKISKGDERIYVYGFFNENKPIIGTMKNIRVQLTQSLEKIRGAPFSKLELAEFLNLDEYRLNIIKIECYNFMRNINEEYAEQWARDNSISNKIQIPNFVNNKNAVQISRDRRKCIKVRYVVVSHINKQYVLKSKIDDISILEKRKKAFPIKLHGRNKKYSINKSTIVSFIVSHKNNIQYKLKLNPDDILPEKQKKHFLLKYIAKKTKHRRYRR